MSNTKATFVILLCSVFLAHAQSGFLIEGYVSDPEGKPLTGVSVFPLDQTYKGTPTDTLGYFKLMLIANVDSIRITSTGFQPQTVSIFREMPMRIELQPAVFQLEEVFVTGFGQQSARSVTGAISKTGPAAFERMPFNSWQLGLQGQLPGVTITPASGGQAAASSIRVRGVHSISAGNQPLIVIDGMIMPAQNGSWTLGFQTNPLQTLNPEDIASVEVLKDAASAAIFGAQAGNGVLLITTKTGKPGAPRFRAGYFAGFSEASQRYDVLNGREYATLWNQAAENTGFSNLIYNVDAQPDTDWQSLILQRGFQHQAYASFSGGNEQTQYYVSANYKDEDGYLITTNLERLNLRANIRHQFSPEWTAGLNLAPSRAAQRYTGHQFLGSPHAWSAWFLPNTKAFDEQGELIRTPLRTSLGLGGINGNPLVVLKDQEMRLETQQILGGSYVEFAPLPQLRFRSTLAVEQTYEQEQGYNGPATFFGRFGGSASRLHQQLNSLQWSSQATWAPLRSGAHNLEVIAGMQYLKSDFTVDFASGGPVDDRNRVLTATSQINEYFSEAQAAEFLGYFSQLHYQFKEKWLATLSARYDGSTRFGRDEQFGFFPALGVGRILIDHTLNRHTGLQYLKVKGSIGKTGNAAIEDLAAYSLVNLRGSYLGQSSITLQSLGNPQLGWEETVQLDMGLDFAFWQSRLSGTLGFFNRNSSDLLLQAPVPATNGINTIWRNAGAIRNTGIELELRGKVVEGPLSWDISANATWLRNEVVALPDTDGDGTDNELLFNNYNLFRPGEPAGAFYLIRYAGVDPGNGDALFYQKDGSTTNQAALASREVAGSPIPDISGGLQHRVRHGPLSLTVFFHFKVGHQAYLNDFMHLEENFSTGNFNQLRSQLNAWTPENTNTDVPQARLFQPNGNQMSTRYLHDADFLRLQNLTLSYDWRLKRDANVKMRVYASAQNLWTWTRYPGLAPNSEFFNIQSGAQGGRLYNLPAARTFILGLETEW